MIHRNRRAIHLNNVAVDQFESGLLVNAFQALSEATALLTADTEERQQQADSHSGMYRYFWVECSSTYNRPKENKQNELCLNEGISSFLCLRALKLTINPQDLDKLDSVGGCGYSWVIWYNLALVSNLMGTRLGEKGYNLLGKAFDLLQKVQNRINSETVTCDWSFLQMAIINNQACIYRELAMMDALHKSLDKLGESLFCQANFVVGKQHRDTFYFNFVVLSGQTFAPAA